MALTTPMRRRVTSRIIRPPPAVRAPMAARLRPLVASSVGTLLTGGLRVTVGAVPEPEPGAPRAASDDDGGELTDGEDVSGLVIVEPSTEPLSASDMPPDDPPEDAPAPLAPATVASPDANVFTDCCTVMAPRCSSSRLARAGTHDGTMGLIDGTHTGTGDCVWVSVNLICRPVHDTSCLPPGCTPLAVAGGMISTL